MQKLERFATFKKKKKNDEFVVEFLEKKMFKENHLKDQENMQSIDVC